MESSFKWKGTFASYLTSSSSSFSHHPFKRSSILHVKPVKEFSKIKKIKKKVMNETEPCLMKSFRRNHFYYFFFSNVLIAVVCLAPKTAPSNKSIVTTTIMTIVDKTPRRYESLGLGSLIYNLNKTKTL